MIMLPAVEQWANAYTFSTVANVQSSDNSDVYQNFIVLVCPTHQRSGLLFDGSVSVFSTWVCGLISVFGVLSAPGCVIFVSG